MVSLISSFGGYINGKNSANLELLIDKTSSIYLYVKLKALASWIFLSFTRFWRNFDSYEYKNKSARRHSKLLDTINVLDILICWKQYFTSLNATKFNLKNIIDTRNLLEYYLKSYKQSLKEKKTTSNMSKLDKNYICKYVKLPKWNPFLASFPLKNNYFLHWLKGNS